MLFIYKRSIKSKDAYTNKTTVFFISHFVIISMELNMKNIIKTAHISYEIFLMSCSESVVEMDGLNNAQKINIEVVLLSSNTLTKIDFGNQIFNYMKYLLIKMPVKH